MELCHFSYHLQINLSFDHCYVLCRVKEVNCTCTFQCKSAAFRFEGSVSILSCIVLLDID